MIYDCLISDIVNRGHIDTGHGHKLERIIIYLIMIEVFFECLHFYERYFNVLLPRHNSPNISSPENMEDCQFWNPETQVTLKKWLNSWPKERLLLPRKRRKKERLLIPSCFAFVVDSWPRSILLGLAIIITDAFPF